MSHVITHDTIEGLDELVKRKVSAAVVMNKGRKRLMSETGNYGSGGKPASPLGGGTPLAA